MELHTYGMTELCELSGAKATQVEHWCRLGIIVPLQDAPGRGSYRVFSLANVIEANQASVFAAHGLSGKQLQQLFAVQRQKTAAAGFTHSAFVALQWLVLTIKGIALATHQADHPGYVALIRDGEALITRVGKVGGGAGLSRLRAGVQDSDDQILQLLTARAASRAATERESR